MLNKNVILMSVWNNSVPLTNTADDPGHLYDLYAVHTVEIVYKIVQYFMLHLDIIENNDRH